MCTENTNIIERYCEEFKTFLDKAKHSITTLEESLLELKLLHHREVDYHKKVVKSWEEKLKVANERKNF